MSFIFFLPLLLELIDHLKFSIQPDISPISLGNLLIWILGFPYFTKEYVKNPIFKSYLFIILGLFLSGILSPNPLHDISRTTAILFNLITSIGFAKYLFDKKNIVNKLHILFLSINLYWLYYVYSLYFSGKINLEFHFNSYHQDVVTVNSHTVSLAISVSAIYLFHFFLSLRKIKFVLLGFLLLAASIFAMMITQTRSNVTITILLASVVLLWSYSNRISIKQLMYMASVFFILFSLIPNVTSVLSDQESSFFKRFDINDEEYQNATTNTRRLVYIKLYEKLNNDFFGTGIIRPKLFIGTENVTNLLMHNQYATWIVAGGWVSLIGTIFLIYFLISYFGLFFKLSNSLNNSTKSLNLASLTYCITLLTVEQTSMMFFIITGLIIYQQSYFLSIFNKK